MPAERVVGYADNELWPPEHVAQFVSHDTEVFATRTATEYELTATIARQRKTFLAWKFPLFKPDGEPYAICGVGGRHHGPQAHAGRVDEGCARGLERARRDGLPGARALSRDDPRSRRRVHRGARARTIPRAACKRTPCSWTERSARTSTTCLPARRARPSSTARSASTPRASNRSFPVDRISIRSGWTATPAIRCTTRAASRWD